MLFHKAAFLIVVYFVHLLSAQEIRNTVSENINKFSLNVLREANNEVGDPTNIAISPYNVWLLLAIVAEGAHSTTQRQLEGVLGIPQNNKDVFRRGVQAHADILRLYSNGVNLETSNAIFTKNGYPLKADYENIVKSYYKANFDMIDFERTQEAANHINKYVAQQTKNRVTDLVKEDNLKYAYIFMTSTLFFKGAWQIPFNKTATRIETFYDERGQPKGPVEMMYQTAAYPYTLISELKAFGLELPYGDGKKTSMIILLPRRNEMLSDVLVNLSSKSFDIVIDALNKAADEFADEDVEVYLPKFKVDSEFMLNKILMTLGIRDLFDSRTANLLGMFNQYLYLNRMLQKAVIDVDEDGTVASAASGASFAYKTSQPKMIANKPFAYFIVDKPTRTILFAGKITNPHTICDRCNAV